MKSVFVVIVVSILTAIYFQDPYLRLVYKFITGYFVSNFNKSDASVRLFTKDELKLYNGIDKPQLYLSILGNVFDVTKGEKFYKTGSTYNAFLGRDASRNFISGDFEEDKLTDDVTGLSPQDLKSLSDWMAFYKKSYTKVGKLIGRYYDDQGKATQYAKEIQNVVKRLEKEKASQDLEKAKFPACNIEYNPESGTRFWCSKQSGGVERNWVGVPRQYFDAGTKNYRCACIEEDKLKELGNIKEYDNCDSKSISCYVKDN